MTSAAADENITTGVVRALGAGDLDAMEQLTDRAYADWGNRQTRALMAADVRVDRGDAVNLGLFHDERLTAMARALLIGGPWHIVDVCTDPVWQGRGCARVVLAELLGALRQKGDDEGITLEVRASNVPAQRLYGAAGFVSHGRRRGYYTDNGEDAVVMWRPPQSVIAAGTAGGWEPQL